MSVSRIGSMACRQSRIWLVLRDHAAERDPPVLSLPPSPPRFRARRPGFGRAAQVSGAPPEAGREGEHQHGYAEHAEHVRELSSGRRRDRTPERGPGAGKVDCPLRRRCIFFFSLFITDRPTRP